MFWRVLAGHTPIYASSRQNTPSHAKTRHLTPKHANVEIGLLELGMFWRELACDCIFWREQCTLAKRQVVPAHAKICHSHLFSVIFSYLVFGGVRMEEHYILSCIVPKFLKKSRNSACTCNSIFVHFILLIQIYT
jgi:hypothetical protein